MNTLLKVTLSLVVVSSLVTNVFADSKRPYKNTPDDFWAQWNLSARNGVTVMQPQVESRREYSYEPTPSLKAGDTVFAARATVDVKLGDRVIANVPQGTRLTVLSVLGQWIGVNVEQNGHLVAGWILASDLAINAAAIVNNVSACR
jgi:hypothetical protein